MIRLIRAALVAAALIHYPLAHGANIFAFGNAETAVPTEVAVGTVFARHTFTPADLCGKPVCDITGGASIQQGQHLGAECVDRCARNQCAGGVGAGPA